MTSPPKPPDFGPPKRLRAEYERAMRQVTGRVLAPRRPEQSLDDWLAELADRSQRKDVQEAAELLARRMVAQVDAGNQRTWREAARKSMQGGRLYRMLQRELAGSTGRTFNRLVAENAKYITSISVDAAARLVGEVKGAQLQGARPETIARMMRTRFSALLRSRVQLIARTQTAKASSALTQARAEDLDMPVYEWLTSEDARVRASHRNMNGVLVFWADPPSPEALLGEKSTLGAYNVGSCPNCRCTASVVLSLDDVRWPHRVYRGGVIRSMTRREFLAIATGDLRRAA